MPRRVTVAVAVLAAVILGGVLMTPVTLVRVADADGNALLCARADDATMIVLTFTHSMYGGDVSETYQPDRDGGLRRTAILTDNLAAAEYYAWDGAVREVDGRYEVMVPDTTFAALPVRIDQVGNHRLTVDDDTWNLAGMVDDSAQAWLSVTTRPLLTQAFGARC